MDAGRSFILTLYLCFGLLVAVLAVPLIRRRVAPNVLYGFRTRRTLEDRGVWYEANAYAGRCLLGSGLATAALSLALYFVPALDFVGYSLACLAVCLGGLAVGVGLSFRFLNNLPPG